MSLEQNFEVITDALDYSPEDTAIITATGTEVGGAVQFQIQHVSGPGADGVYGTADDTVIDLGGDGHDAWIVVDGGEGDLDGLANGTVITEWFVNPDDSLGQTFLLTAQEVNAGTDGVLGTADDVYGRLATSSFTDATQYGLDQWANGPDTGHDPLDDEEWVNGNLGASKAHYFYDDFVPYRAQLTDLQEGMTYALQIQFDLTEGGEYAIDYIGTYDYSFQTGAPHEGDGPIDPTDGLTITDGGLNVSTLEIPLDPLVLAGDDGVTGTADDISQEPGVMTAWGVDLLGYATAGADGDIGTGDDIYYLASDDGSDTTWGDGNEVMVTRDQYFSGLDLSTVTDTITSLEVGDAIYERAGSVAGSSTVSFYVVFEYQQDEGDDGVISWGGHIATPDDWANADPSGSPYHMRLLDWVGYDGAKDAKIVGTGNQDRSLSRNVIQDLDPQVEVDKTVREDGSADAFVNELTLDPAVNGVQYQYVLTNSGDGALLDVDLIDDNGTPLDLTDDVDLIIDGVVQAGVTVTAGGFTDEDGDTIADDLGAGGSITVVWSTTVPVGDTENVATVTGDDADEDITYSDTDAALVHLPPAPAIDLEKSYAITDEDAGDGEDNTTTVDEVGDVITYTVTVEN
ncbi:hypothetical protein, partial [Albidovulum sediminis]